MLIRTMLPRDASSHLIGLCLLLQVPFFLSLSHRVPTLLAFLQLWDLCICACFLRVLQGREKKREGDGEGGVIIWFLLSIQVSSHTKLSLSILLNSLPLCLPQHLTLEDLKSSFSLLASWLSTPARMPSPHLPFPLPDLWQVQENLMYKKQYLLNE